MGLEGITKFMQSIFYLIFYTLEGIVYSLIPHKLLTRRKLSSDIVLITGAGSGIGREIALNISDYGCPVILWDVNEEGNKETKELITQRGGTAHTYTVDVANRDHVYKTAAKVIKDVGEVTILINNAGIVNLNGVLNIPDDRIQQCLQINTLAHFWTVKAFLPSMVERNRGHIVGIASMLGLVAMPALSDYCCSKFGAMGFMEALDLELRYMKKDITVTKVCLGIVDTPLARNAGHQRSQSPLTPPSTKADYVAERIVDAIRTNETLLMCPWEVYPLMLIKRFLPTKAFHQFLSIIYDPSVYLTNSTSSTN